MTPDGELRDEEVRREDETIDTPDQGAPEEELSEQERRKRWEENGPDPINQPDHVAPTPLNKPDSMSLEQYHLQVQMGLAKDDPSDYGPGNESYLGYPTAGNQDTSRVKASLVHEPESKETTSGNPVSPDEEDHNEYTDDEKDEFGIPKQ